MLVGRLLSTTQVPFCVRLVTTETDEEAERREGSKSENYGKARSPASNFFMAESKG